VLGEGGGNWLLVKLVLGSAALAGAGMPEVLLPLTDALEGRHAPVVITEIDNPLPLVKHLLQSLGGLQIHIGLLSGQLVNGGEMPQQLRSLPAVTGK